MTYTETCDDFADLGRRKGELAFRSPGAFFAGAMLAGAYVGIALILALTCSAGLPAGVRPLVNGAVFGIGLVLVVLAGAELFTGLVMYAAFGLAKKRTRLLTMIGALAFVWIGNLAGSVLLAFLFAKGGGGAIYGAPASFLHDYVMKKETSDVVALVCRASLCNWLVCLAIWTAARIKSETGKILAIAWCLLAFVACGFEHSVANMTVFALGLFDPTPAGTLYGAAYNLLWVTLGNLIGGGVFVAGAYLWYARGDAPPAAPGRAAA